MEYQLMNVNKDDPYPSTAMLLEESAVIGAAQDADLHFDSNGVRLWVHRTGLDDGEPFENTITVELLTDVNQESHWTTVATYDGDNPPSTIGNKISFGALYFNHTNFLTLDSLTVLLDDVPLYYDIIVSDDGTIALKTDLIIDEAGFLHDAPRDSEPFRIV